MKKLLICLLAACLPLSVCGCAKTGKEAMLPAENAEATGEGEETREGPVIDTASLDIDGDGVKEDCSITYGPTSGLFSVVITAAENRNVKYRNTFVLPWCRLSFAEQDGAPQLVMEITEYRNPETRTESHRLYTENGRIVIEGLDPDAGGYWGGADWNTGME